MPLWFTAIPGPPRPGFCYFYTRGSGVCFWETTASQFLFVGCKTEIIPFPTHDHIKRAKVYICYVLYPYNQEWPFLIVPYPVKAHRYIAMPTFCGCTICRLVKSKKPAFSLLSLFRLQTCSNRHATTHLRTHFRWLRTIASGSLRCLGRQHNGLERVRRPCDTKMSAPDGRLTPFDGFRVATRRIQCSLSSILRVGVAPRAWSLAGDKLQQATGLQCIDGGQPVLRAPQRRG